MTRIEARTFLMEVLFQMDINKQLDKEHILEYLKKKNYKGQERYLNEVLEYICDNYESIDETINNHSNRWKTNRMPRIDLSILRLSVAEQKCRRDIPPAVTINEAVNLAKKYSDEASPGFVNAVLGSIINE